MVSAGRKTLGEEAGTATDRPAKKNRTIRHFPISAFRGSIPLNGRSLGRYCSFGGVTDNLRRPLGCGQVTLEAGGPFTAATEGAAQRQIA
jgi:hypothetical protein